MHIRALLPQDWEDVSAIIAGSAGPSTLDGELPTWEQWDARHLPGSRLVAANREGRVTAWAALEPVSERPALAGVAAVSVFVDPTYRGQGFGRHLLANLIAASEQAGLWTLQAYVAPQNTAAIHLLEELGFRKVGRRERFAKVDGVWHDAVLLERRTPAGSPAETLPPPAIAAAVPEAS
ncbi:MAG: GNAT family N-acetyltransferase [Bifidobacteriaceae bacterium]|jgi:phosphinothricin acetyltransferase|nr:GNAT family N-acetyltransferase [Bifidobacteriaceae bacterium]